MPPAWAPAHRRGRTTLGVRHRARGRLRAAAPRAAGDVGRARARLRRCAAAGVAGRPAAPDRPGRRAPADGGPGDQPRCGCTSTAGGAPPPVADERRGPGLVVETAHRSRADGRPRSGGEFGGPI